jgi:hypothetical protein
MTGFELDPDAMVEAKRRLAGLRDELVAHQKTANRLAAPLANGTAKNPVVKEMRSAFSDRADNDGGVQAVLQDYIDELDDIQDAILITLATYKDLDSGAAAAMPRPAGGPEAR